MLGCAHRLACWHPHSRSATSSTVSTDAFLALRHTRQSLCLILPGPLSKGPQFAFPAPGRDLRWSPLPTFHAEPCPGPVPVLGPGSKMRSLPPMVYTPHPTFLSSLTSIQPRPPLPLSLQAPRREWGQGKFLWMRVKIKGTASD